jgi:hypothetical protein
MVSASTEETELTKKSAVYLVKLQQPCEGKLQSILACPCISKQNDIVS